MKNASSAKDAEECTRRETNSSGKSSDAKVSGWFQKAKASLRARDAKCDWRQVRHTTDSQTKTSKGDGVR